MVLHRGEEREVGSDAGPVQTVCHLLLECMNWGLCFKIRKPIFINLFVSLLTCLLRCVFVDNGGQAAPFFRSVL